MSMTFSQVSMDRMVFIPLIPLMEVMAIYFIQRESDAAIKIGYSEDVPTRLGVLRSTGNGRLSLLCAIEGDMVIEKQLHMKFNEDRIEGEWYEPSEVLVAYIDHLINCKLSNHLSIVPATKHTSIRLSEAHADKIAATGQSPTTIIKKALDLYFGIPLEDIDQFKELLDEHVRRYHSPG